MTRKRITVSFKEKVFNKLEIARKKKKLSTYLNDHFEEEFGIGSRRVNHNELTKK